MATAGGSFTDIRTQVMTARSAAQDHSTKCSFPRSALQTSRVREIPRSRYTHVTGRRRMGAVVLHAVSRDFDLSKSWSYIWLNAGLTTKVRV